MELKPHAPELTISDHIIILFFPLKCLEHNILETRIHDIGVAALCNGKNQGFGVA